jgi:hypothetical protein
MWRFRCKEIVCRERIRLCATRPCAKVHSAHCFPCENRVPLGPIWTYETQPYHLVGIYKDHQGPRLDSLHDSRLSRFRKTYFTLLPLSTWSAWRKLLPSLVMPRRNGVDIARGFFINRAGRTSASNSGTAGQAVSSSPAPPPHEGIYRHVFFV